MISAIKRFIRNEGFAWPGGYQMALLMADGELLCAKCARQEFRQIITATRFGYNSPSWKAETPIILWEGEPEHCAHCNTEIPTAYGPAEVQS